MAKYHTPPGDGLEPIVREFQKDRRQMREQARPEGTRIAELVAKVRETLQNINASVVAAIEANSYTKSEINARIAAPSGNVAAAGNVSAGGTLSAVGAISGASVSTGGPIAGLELYGSNAPLPANNITTARVTSWLRISDGLVGNTASSRRFKTNIVQADLDPLAILSVDVFYHSYIAEVRKRDDPTFEDYVGPDYHVAQELALMAEDLHEAGLWEFVIYEREPDGTLILNDDGEAVPRSIHYELWAMAVHAATKYLHEQILGHGERIASLETRLNAAGL